MSSKDRSIEFLLQFMLHTETQLIEKGCSEIDAKEIAHSTCEHIRKNFSGGQFYFPKGRKLDALILQHKIYAEFTGNNHFELSIKHNVTVKHVYQVVAAEYKKELDERQPDLF